MRRFIWVAAGLLVLAAAAFFLLFSKQEGAPFGYSALVEQDEGRPATCGLAYMGRTADRSHAYKVAMSTRILEDLYVVLTMQVSALRITDLETMSGDRVKVEDAKLSANGYSTETLTRPGGTETDDYIAVSTDPGELMTFPFDMLQGADLRLTIAGQPALDLRLPRAGNSVADKVIDCFKAMKAFAESAAQANKQNGP